jgi:CheY-like chemotaxis protein
MISLVDDLLDVSRITRDKTELCRERLDMKDVIAAAVEQAAPLIEKRKHALEVDSPDSGLIRVIVRGEEREVVVSVIDHGIGIEYELLPRIFDTFVQGRTTFDRGHGGLGLGLAIVRSLVMLHGGTVSADSAGPGRGAQFTVRLPRLIDLGESAQHPVTPVATQATATVRILIVDDNRDAAETMAELFRLNGHEVSIAFDAARAIEIATRTELDIAFIDLGLPGINGYEVADAIRSVPAHRSLPVVAVSGYGSSEDRRKTTEHGFSGHFVKPVTAEELQGVIDAVAVGESRVRRQARQE